MLPRAKDESASFSRLSARLQIGLFKRTLSYRSWRARRLVVQPLSRRDGFARDPKLLVGVRSDFTVRAMLVDVESLVYDLRTCQGVVQTSRDRS